MSVSLLDNYPRQIRILHELRDESIASRARFEAAREAYQQQIRKAESMGYMGDYVEQLQVRFREFHQKMDEMLQTLVRVELQVATQETRMRQLLIDAQRTD